MDAATTAKEIRHLTIKISQIQHLLLHSAMLQLALDRFIPLENLFLRHKRGANRSFPSAGKGFFVVHGDVYLQVPTVRPAEPLSREGEAAGAGGRPRLKALDLADL